MAPVVRGACCLKDEGGEGAHRRMILEFRTGDAILNFVNGAELHRYGAAGVITPDYTIRTKSWPLILPAPEAGKPDEFKRAVRQAAAAYIDNYKQYFARHNARVGGGKIMVDPLPRIVLVPGLGLFGLGRSAKDARIAADLAEAAVATITDAEAIGRFQSITEADMFDCEYWPIEQAKLGREPRARWPARSRSSPAPAARSGRRRRRRSPRWRRSRAARFEFGRRHGKGRKRSGRMQSRSAAT